MKSRISWIAAGLLFFVIALIVKLPAQQVIGRISLPSKTSVTNVSGTLWHGYASALSVQGVVLNGAEWHVRPWALLLGKLRVDIDAGKVRDGEEAAVKGRVEISLWSPDTISVAKTLLYLPASQIFRQLPLPLPVLADGRLRVDIEQLTFAQQRCQTLSGKGDWLNARVLGSNGMIDVGNFCAQLGCEQSQITLSLNDANVLGLILNARVSQDFKRVTGEGQFKLSSDLPTEVHQAAAFFGKADASGVTGFSF